MGKADKKRRKAIAAEMARLTKQHEYAQDQIEADKQRMKLKLKRRRRAKLKERLEALAQQREKARGPTTPVDDVSVQILLPVWEAAVYAQHWILSQKKDEPEPKKELLGEMKTDPGNAAAD